MDAGPDAALAVRRMQGLHDIPDLAALLFGNSLENIDMNVLRHENFRGLKLDFRGFHTGVLVIVVKKPQNVVQVLLWSGGSPV